MCFSASASFVSATFLSLSAAVTLAQLKNKNYLFFATIPLLFAIQQAAEGIVWLSFANPQLIPWRDSATMAFIFFAFIVWPLWIPLSLLMIEQKQKTKNSLEQCQRAGIIVAVCLSFFLLGQQITANVDHNHIEYAFNAPLILNISLTLLYLYAIVTPFFIVHNTHMKWFGSLLVLSYIISYIFYSQVHISVWCFFAAALSFLVFAYTPKQS